MKSLKYITIVASIFFFSCKKTIDLYPVSYLNTGTYYTNLAELKQGLAGCYAGLQEPMKTEWMLTELRSDNSKQGVTGSSSASNRELNQLDMFTLDPNHPQVYNYWMNVYYNIRNTNIVLEKLGVVYDPATGTNSLQPINVTLTDADRRQMAGEALFIRAYHYFNLVRLYGGVFLVHKTVSPVDAKAMNRVSVDEVYKLIQADLKTASEIMSTAKYAQIPLGDLGKANGWAAKALLGKVFLTLNKKAEALTLLNDVRLNSGFGLVTTAGTAGHAFNNVFSTANEVNSEILFTIRYKAGGLGLGSPFANTFAPLNSGSAVVAGDGLGLNYPTADVDSTIKTTDGRKGITVARYVSGASTKSYTRKYIVTTVTNDGESDWPVLRFADVLLMIAEAQGNSQTSIDMINLVRVRAGVPAISSAGITTTKLFEDTLSTERRVEFAFENQRWFDLLRFNTTFTTITAQSAMQAHFAKEFPVHYKDYPAPSLSLAELQANVTSQKLLLPIPQREFDTNPRLVGQQNPGY